MENTMVHELMHMYDQCRFKVDWNDLRHHACSEVSLRFAFL
jgi:inner membrane protease ATP23